MIQQSKVNYSKLLQCMWEKEDQREAVVVKQTQNSWTERPVLQPLSYYHWATSKAQRLPSELPIVLFCEQKSFIPKHSSKFDCMISTKLGTKSDHWQFQSCMLGYPGMLATRASGATMSQPTEFTRACQDLELPLTMIRHDHNATCPNLV